MRFSLIGSVTIVLALTSLAPSTVAAQRANNTKVDYGPKCVCQFGYGGNGCVAAIACGIEGGRCSKSCIPQDDSQSAH
jgi:hypothetical protein